MNRLQRKLFACYSVLAIAGNLCSVDVNRYEDYELLSDEDIIGEPF